MDETEKTSRISDMIRVIEAALEGDASVRATVEGDGGRVDELAHTLNRLLASMPRAQGRPPHGEPPSSTGLRPPHGQIGHGATGHPGAAPRAEGHGHGRSGESYLYGFLHSMPYPAFVVDRDERVLFVNEGLAAWLDDLGISRDVHGAPLIEAIPFLSADDRAALHEVLDTGESRVHMGKGTVGGRSIWYELHVVSIVVDGVVTGIVSVVKDISRLKQAELDARIEQNKLQSLVDSLEYGITIQDRDYTIVFQNHFMRERFGHLGDKCHCVYEFSDVVCEGCPMTESFADGQSHTVVRRVVQPDGSVIYWENTSTPIRDDKGVITTCLEIVRDITERKRREEALQESEVKYRTVVESSLVGVYLIQDGLFQYINHKLCDIFGYTPDEVIGKLSPLDVISEEQREQLRERLSLQLGDKIADVEFVTNAIRRDGKILTIKVLGSTVKYGGSTAICGTVMDITDAMAVEEQLRQSQKLESVGRLAGGVAHDFNNVLSIITGFAELSLLVPSLPDDARRYLTSILDAASRSTESVRQLLGFARKQTFAPRAVDLNTSVEGMLPLLVQLIGEDIRLDWLPGEGLWSVLMDPAQIEQILINLCANARDAIEGVGRITIETANTVFDDEYCATHAEVEPGEYVVVRISDDGMGMDKATIASVFEPFFTTKDTGRGTGLGLANVYGIVKQNDGFINVYSEPGLGSTFKIYLARHACSVVQPRREAPTRVTPTSKGETVLVVEDEGQILKIIDRFLTMQGYQVIAVAAPEDAIRVAESHDGPIDLLITDVILPQMNGSDLAASLAKTRQGIRCLFMSGCTVDVIATRGLLDEGVHFLHKPFSLPTLLEKVRCVLDEA